MSDAFTSISVFRIVVLSVSFIQLLTYAVVALASLLFGYTDFAWPIKMAYLSIVGLLIIVPAYHVQKSLTFPEQYPDMLRMSLLQLFLELVAASFLIIYGLPIILQSFASGGSGLNMLGPEFRSLAGSGVALIFIFAALTLYDLVSFKRIGPVPKLAVPPKK